MSATNTREKRTEIRWLGDENTENALLGSLGLEMPKDAAPGYCERWLSVPVRQLDTALKALATSGARVLKPEP